MSNKKCRVTKDEMVLLCDRRGTNIEEYKPRYTNSYRLRLTIEEQKWLDDLRKNSVVEEEYQPKKVNKEDKLIALLKERYSEKELELLVKGEGLHDRELDYPEIHLYGKHHKIGVISDGHLGSKYSPIEWHYQAFKTFEKEGCECILHCGDVVDGLTPRRISTQIYELTHIGYKAQRDLAVDVFSHSNLPVYIISGNHCAYYQEFAGANIVEDICSKVDNMTYLGHNQADMDIDGITIRLFHGVDGNSYALSYRLQKIVEAFTGGKKPNILLAGHVHKFCYIFERNVHAVSVPTLQMQTSFMQGKKLAAHTGFLIIDFDTYNNSVCNFKVQLFPFYG